MRRLVIAIDCDDVLILTAEATINAYNAMYGTKLEPKDFYSHATIETWGTTSEEEAVRRVVKYIGGKEFAATKPDESTINAVAKLATKHELHLVTGRQDELEAATRSLLDEYFPGCFTSIEHTNYFHGSKSRSKGEVCQQIGANVLIDDHIVHGESVLAHGVEEVIVFGDYPWNASDRLVKGMVRCVDWTEVEKEIERIAHG